MEEHLVKNFLVMKLMEINKLVDLNNLRTAPQLSKNQEKTFGGTRSNILMPIG